MIFNDGFQPGSTADKLAFEISIVDYVYDSASVLLFEGVWCPHLTDLGDHVLKQTLQRLWLAGWPLSNPA